MKVLLGMINDYNQNHDNVFQNAVSGNWVDHQL